MSTCSAIYHKKEGGPKSTRDMSQEELLFYSINYFHDSLEKRAEMGARTALWTNRVVRSGIFGLMLIATSILILVVVVSLQMKQIAGVMLEMDGHMELMVNDTKQMSDYLIKMGESVSIMPMIVDEIATMESTIKGMTGNIGVISEQMDYTVVVGETIISDMESMDRNLYSVSHIVQGMDYNINKISGPFQSFNRMMP